MKKEEYNKEYHKLYIKGVYIPFNATNRNDQALSAWLAKQGNKTAYIKSLIARDMKAAKEFKL
jgi:hypothetical protein